MPVVLMEVTTSEGQIKTFELPVEKFHELRFVVVCLFVLFLIFL